MKKKVLQAEEKIGQIKVAQVSIAAGASVSGPINMTGYEPLFLQMPAAFTGSHIGLQISIDGGVTYGNLYDSQGELFMLPVAVDAVVDLSGPGFALEHLTYLRITSIGNIAEPEAPEELGLIAQEAARVLKFMVEDL